MDKPLESFFFRDVPYKILLFVFENPDVSYSTNISFELKTSYSYVADTVKKFQAIGVFTYEKKGRIVHITLTEKGREMALALKKFVGLMNGEIQKE